MEIMRVLGFIGVIMVAVVALIGVLCAAVVYQYGWLDDTPETDETDQGGRRDDAH